MSETKPPYETATATDQKARSLTSERRAELRRMARGLALGDEKSIAMTPKHALALLDIADERDELAKYKTAWDELMRACWRRPEPPSVTAAFVLDLIAEARQRADNAEAMLADFSARVRELEAEKEAAALDERTV